MEKKFATILCSDVVGYSKLMRVDELATLKKLDRCRIFIDPLVEQHNGRIFNTAGDSVLVEFLNPYDAIKFSIDMQTGIRDKQLGLKWRIGIHMGEVFPYGTNLLGDTVNLAARIESSADYGGIFMSDVVYNYLVSHGMISNYVIENRGKHTFKNIDNPINLWSIKINGAELNPFANVIKEAKFSREQLIKSVINDKPAINKTLQDAQYCRSMKQYGPATRILMWRITKRCASSVDELLDMAVAGLVPSELHQVCVAILSELLKVVDSSRAKTIYKLLQGPLGVHPEIGLQFLKQAAKTDSESQLEYSWIIVNDPRSLPDQVDRELKVIFEMAEKQNVPAISKLTEYYEKHNNKKEQFCWLWVLRGLFDPMSQSKLEQLTNSISKVEFNNWKIEADALLDEIKFKNNSGYR